MNFLRKLFGGNKKENRPSTEDIIQKLQSVEKMVVKRQQYLEKKIEQEKMTAKKYIKTNKQGALQALAHKKRYEKQLTQTNGTLLNIKQQQEALFYSDVNDMKNDVAESQALLNDISQVISYPAMFEDDVDGDALQNELEELLQEELNNKLLNTNKILDTYSPIPIKSYQHCTK